uniref:Uncharacterized protein n=1 Tax=Oryza meridionalis TaxID=40149 RepID=A0A0E0D1B5_9ORYZ
MDDEPINAHKLLKEQFVSNLTGSSLLEIAALSTVVPAVVVLRKWSCGGFQTWLSFGSNEYLISNERNVGIISQNKEGYWGMYLIGVSLGYNLFFDNSSKGKSRSSQVCNFAYVMLVFGQNFQT